MNIQKPRLKITVFSNVPQNYAEILNEKIKITLKPIKYTLEGYVNDTVNCYDTNPTTFCLHKFSGAEISNTTKCHLKKTLIGQIT